MWASILSIYLIISIFAFLFSMVPLDIYNDKFYSWKNMFVFQRWLYDNMKDRLNLLGIIILEIIVTILTFGASVTLFACTTMVCVLLLCWKLYCLVFKKR